MPSLRDAGKITGPLSIRDQAKACNFGFPLSLRDFIVGPGCPFNRFVRLHVKMLQQPTLDLDPMFRAMRTIYARAGIRVELASTEDLTGPAFATLLDIDVGECLLGQTPTAEQSQLFANRANAGGNDVVVYFVRTVTYFDPTLNNGAGGTGTLNGCASHPNGQPGAVVAQTATPLTMAHEVGHVLGLRHFDPSVTCGASYSTNRLMTKCFLGNGSDAVLIQSEIDRMMSSNFTQAGFEFSGGGA
jgi:hypothetical protein